MKTKNLKRIWLYTLVFTMAAMYGFLPPVFNAGAVDAIQDAADLITDSDLSATADHAITFTTNNEIPDGGYLLVSFQNQVDWDIIDNTHFTCPGTGAEVEAASYSARCNYAGAALAAGAQTFNFTDIVNPATSSTYYIDIVTYNSADTILERVTVAIRIIDDILMTAKVDSTLTFNISGTTTAAVIGGIACSNASTATTTPFGTLEANATSTVCQTLEVTTNASDGFIVTVEQSDELTNDSNNNINSFDNSQDNTGSSTAPADPHAWTSPRNELDNYHTYGHMGLYSDDTDLATYGYLDFNNGGATLFAGLNNTDPMVVFHHFGPSDGETQSRGMASILYQAEIGTLQEAGDYETTLTYIVTPTF